ncbi:MAG: hypothetical protein ACXWVH_08150, partial [Caulobacteraceae bacterium]
MLSSLILAAAVAVGADSRPSQAVEATLQSCTLEEIGWVCRYRVPQNVQPSPSVIQTPRRPPEEASFPQEAAVQSAEQIRQEKLIRRCADASWLSLCTPGDRKEAAALRKASEARGQLRSEVTSLVGQGNCGEAVAAA